MADIYFEIAADNWLNLNTTWRAELDGSKVDYYHSDNGKETVDYGDPGAAALALAAFILAANGLPPVLLPITVGDKVRLRGPGNKNTSENIDYTVEHLPSGEFPWWALRGSQTNTLYVMTIGDDRIMELVT